MLSFLRSSLSNTKINFMKPHKLALFMSVFCIIASLILVFAKGLNFGIDFAGGILIEARIGEDVDVSSVRNLITAQVKDVQIQNVDKTDLLIRVATNNEAQDAVVKKIQEILNQNFSQVEYRKIDYVGPQVGAELIKKGFLAQLLSFVFIMIYIWIRFDWQFGLGGIFALVHDAILTLGFFALSGLEFNLTSIAAILTVIGYSINDSVVIYDRVREDLRKFKVRPVADVINLAVNETLARTFLTGGTVLMALLGLVTFGGDVLFGFSAAMIFGVIIGTYSSIYVSSTILVYMNLRRSELATTN